jgi:hypothetical protein
MLNKIYASRAQTRVMGLHDPIGDPFGGPAYGEKNDPITAALVVGGAGLVGSQISASGQRKAAQTQADATGRAQDQVLAAGREGAAYYDPYRELGQTGVNALNANLPFLTRQFTNADLNANLAPNYDFMLKQGQGATMQNANVGGGGSNVNLANQIFSQNYAKNAYQDAFNNFQAQQTNIYNRLSGIAGLGMQGATGAANAVIGTGTNVASLTSGLGNAQAASQIGMANAYTGGVNNATNMGAFYGMNQQNPYVQAAQLNQQYGANNVYGVGGGGTVPSGVMDYNIG